ncbi:MAG: peptide ABC transporter substrate-binding protein [Verrucomicrobia bacterium]|nr:peptide ABC transporter substrate-binding protein [Verrucomicrobiota bacterium]
MFIRPLAKRHLADKIPSKIAHFSKQSEFCKRSLQKKRSIFISIALMLCSCTTIKKHDTSLMKKEEATLHIALPADPGSLDPRKNSDFISPSIHFMVFEGLVRMSPNASYELALAEKIDISEDGLVYTFHLRPSYWSDGSLVTAFDFAYAWKTMLEPTFPCPNAYLLYPIKNAFAVKTGKLAQEDLGIEALDEKTFQVTLHARTPYFLNIISYCLFSPVPHKIVEKDPKWADTAGPHFVTNGPFLLEEWRLGDKLVLKKNPTYWDRDTVGLSGVEAYIIRDENTGLKLFEKGELDYYGGFLNPIPRDSAALLKTTHLLHTQKVGATTFITFNLARFPFTNKNIRKAFAYAINRREIIENVTQLEEEVATNYVASTLKNGKQRDLYPDGAYDLAREHLRQGLEELGCDKSALNGLTFTYTGNALQKKVAEAVQAQWKEVFDLDIKMDEGDLKVQLDKFYQRDYQFGQIFLVVQFNDQMDVFQRFKEPINPKNYPGWSNPLYGELLEKSCKTSSEAERFLLLEEAEELLATEMPLSCVFHWNGVFMQQPYLKDSYMSPIGSVHWNRAYLDKKYEKKPLATAEK